jgi:hypothetical protein
MKGLESCTRATSRYCWKQFRKKELLADDGSLKTWRKDCSLWLQQLILKYQRSTMVGDCL